MEQPKRKRTRLKDYDYSSAGVYFVTVCVKDKKPLLWNNVGASIARPQKPAAPIGAAVFIR